MRSRQFGTILAAASVAAARPTNATYLAQAVAGVKAMQHWYDASSGLWSSEGWWNSANSMTIVADLAALDPSFKANATALFTNTYAKRVGSLHNAMLDGGPYLSPPIPHNTPSSSVPSGSTPTGSTPTGSTPTGSTPTGSTPTGSVPSGSGPTSTNPDWPAFTSEYYDDDGWWALAWIAAYDLTKTPKYLSMAQAIFDNAMEEARSTKCGGGVKWSKNKNDAYINAITNELYLSVAAHLAARPTSGADAQDYLEIATEQWEWFLKSGMINAHHTINDGLDSDCHNNGETVWSYNQGVILGALVELSMATTDRTAATAYLNNATVIAQAAILRLADQHTLVLHDECEQTNSCNGDDSQFKGIFMRNLQRLQLVAPHPRYGQFIAANAKSVWTKARSPNNTFSINWAGPPRANDTASSTGSATEALIAAAAVLRS